MNSRHLSGVAFVISESTITAMYGAFLVGATVLDHAHPIGRFRGLIYLAGLLVVPLVLTLFIAGASILLGRRARRRRP